VDAQITKSTHRPSVLVHGCYDNRNYGDLLMADLISRYLKTRHGVLPVIPWVHDCEAGSFPAETGGGLEACAHVVAAVFWGGGYLEAHGRAGVKRLKRYADVARYLQDAEIPYVVAGVGVGQLAGRTSRSMVRSLCAGASALVVRDKESQDVLASIGVDCSQVTVAADVVLGLEHKDLPSSAQEKASKLLGEASNGKRLVGIHLPLGRAMRAHQRDILRIVRSVLGNERSIQVVWIDDAHGYTDYHRQLANDYFPECRVIRNQDRWVTASLVQRLDLVLTCKLHVAITAAALGVAPFGFSLHAKTERLFRQLDRERYQFTIADAVPIGDKTRRALKRLRPDFTQGLRKREKRLLAQWLEEVSQLNEGALAVSPSLRLHLADEAKVNYAAVDRIVSQVLGAAS